MTEEDGNSEELTLPRGIYRWALLGIALIFVGLLVIVIASLAFGSGSGSVGVVIFIGPIPIVFGSGPDRYLLIFIGVIITIISVAVFLVMNRRNKEI